MKWFFVICLMSVNHFSFGQNYFHADSKYDPNVAGYLNDSDLAAANRTIMSFGIPFKYPQGGCESRAFAMHLLLDSLHIPNFRIWLFAPKTYLQNNNELLSVQDKYSKKNISWGYHVAPAVTVKRGNTLDTVILDPALKSKPLSYHKWMQLIGGSGKGYFTFINADFFMFYTTPIQDGKNQIDFFKYEGNIKGYNYGDMKLEKNLALDKVGRHLYWKYVQHSSNPRDTIIEPIITSIKNLENFILGDVIPDDVNVSLRQIYDDFPQFVVDARNEYDRERKRWYEKIKALHHP